MNELFAAHLPQAGKVYRKMASNVECDDNSPLYQRETAYTVSQI